MLEVKTTFISTAEAAKIIGCTAAYVRRLLLDKVLKGQHFSGVWAVDRDSAEDFAKIPQKMGRPRVGE